MARKMNMDLKVRHEEQFVGRNTENVFNDSFWCGLDGICNALDNMEARLYVDAQCVKYEKPLLESGTMGTMGNIDTVKPFATPTYAEGGAAVEGGGIPMCTLRNFPHLTDHCIEWARDVFQFIFVNLAKKATSCVADPEHFEEYIGGLSDSETKIFDIRGVLAFIKAAKAPTKESIAQLAFLFFHLMFRDKIMNLQAAYPADARMKDESGADMGPFWSEKKRYPTAAVFNADDVSHLTFLGSTFCLLGVVLGFFPPKTENDDKWLESYQDPEWIKSLVPKLSVPEYLRVLTSVDANTGVATNTTSDGSESLITGLLEELRAEVNGARLPIMEAIEFEKDDDLNFHIAFVTSAANLRCDNYSLRRTDFQSCKVIAGKIIAAIATTTAAVCGLVVLELFKLTMDKSTDDLKTGAISLAVNYYGIADRNPPAKHFTKVVYELPTEEDIERYLKEEDIERKDIYDQQGNVLKKYMKKNTLKCVPEGLTVWDKIVCDGSMSILAFRDWLITTYGCHMSRWDFTVAFALGEKGKLQPVSTNVYVEKTPETEINCALIPSLDLTFPKATTEIMGNAAIKGNKQRYVNAWRSCKAAGQISESNTVPPDQISPSITLKELLVRLQEKGVSLKETSKDIKEFCITHIEDRLFWIIELPLLVNADGDEVILQSVKIMLK
jgi:hypothetical protein